MEGAGEGVAVGERVEVDAAFEAGAELGGVAIINN